MKAVDLLPFVAASLLSNLPVYVSSALSGGKRSILTVIIPTSLRNTTNSSHYDHEEATFGIPTHGGSISEPLYYVDSDYCNSNTFDKSRYYPSPPFASGAPFLLMINRGGCWFINKVRNAQHMGAAGVIVADNVCLCNDEACRSETKIPTSPICDRIKPIMTDNGSGRDVTIPSVLLNKDDSELFKKTIMERNQTMRVEMKFLPLQDALSGATGRPDQEEHVFPSLRKKSVVAATTTKSKPVSQKKRVVLDLWMTPVDPVTRAFLLRFQPLALAIGSQQIEIRPHMYIFPGIKSGCTETRYWDDDPCYKLCTNHGRYCAADPPAQGESSCNQTLSGIATGAHVVEESLRQLCILSQDNEAQRIFKDETVEGTVGASTTNRRNLWLQYIVEFYQTCLDQWNYLSITHASCQEGIFEKVGILKDSIDRCMADSGGVSANVINNKLEREILDQTTLHISALPTLYVNTVRFDRPHLSAQDVFLQVCRLLSDEHGLNGPAICSSSCHLCPNVTSCLANGGKCPVSLPKNKKTVLWSSSSSPAVSFGDQRSTPSKNGGVSLYTFVSSLLLLFIWIVVLAMGQYHRARAEARDQVLAIFTDYVLLRDEEDDTSADSNDNDNNNSERGQAHNEPRDNDCSVSLDRASQEPLVVP